MQTEIEHIITNHPMTLRKFYNFIKREMASQFDIDWDDFKRVNGQIRDCINDRENGTYKLITEYGEESCYFYYLNA